MNLNGVTLEKEDADAWHVKGRDGESFRVAKKGLSATMHGRIAQHFADDGEVQDFSSYLHPQDPFALAPEAAQPASALMSRERPTLQETMGELAHSSEEDRRRIMENLSPEEARKVRVAQGIEAAPEAGAAARAGMPDVDEVAAAPAPSAPRAPEVATPSAAKAPAVKLPPGTIPGMQGGIDASTKAQQEAARAQAKNAAELAQEQADIQAKSTARLEALQKEWAGRMQANQARVEQTQADIASAKIDPDHFWASRSTGQKVAGVIGLALGGFYAGYTGRDNPAEKLINDAISRDIDAQKSNLGKKQNELSFYVQQGHSIQEAAQLARGDALQRTAAQIQAAALRHAGPEAQAAADATAAKLSEQGLLLKNKVYEDGFHTQAAALQVWAIQQAEAARTQDAGAAGLVMEAARRGQLSPQLVNNLPKDVRERVVQFTEERPVLTKEGRPVLDAEGRPRTAPVRTGGMALDEGSAKTARELVNAYAPANDILTKLIELRKKFGAGRVFDRDATNEAKSLANDYIVQFNAVNHLGALDNGTMEVAKQILGGDQNSIGAVLAPLVALKQRQDKAYRTRLGNLLVSRD